LTFHQSWTLKKSSKQFQRPKQRHPLD